MVRKYHIERLTDGMETLYVRVYRESDKNPCVCLSVSVGGKVLSLSWSRSVSPRFICEEVWRLFNLVESPHWRSTLDDDSPEFELFSVDF